MHLHCTTYGTLFFQNGGTWITSHWTLPCVGEVSRGRITQTSPFRQKAPKAERSQKFHGDIALSTTKVNHAQALANLDTPKLKHNLCGQPHYMYIHFHATQALHNPVSLILSYMYLHQCGSHPGTLFCDASGQLITCQNSDNQLRKCLFFCGLSSQ